MSQEHDGGLWLGTDDPGEEPARSAAPVWQRAVLGVVAVLYLVTAAQAVVVVIGDVLGWASDSLWSWWGTTTPSGRERVRDDVLALTVRGSCLAAVGVVLGVWWRRRAALAVSVVAVAGTPAVRAADRGQASRSRSAGWTRPVR